MDTAKEPLRVNKRPNVGRFMLQIPTPPVFPLHLGQTALEGEGCTPKKKILLLSVSAGDGHTRAAQAIDAYAKLHCSDAIIMHWDVMHYVPLAFRKIYTDWYINLVSTFPAVWRCLYQLSNQACPDNTVQKLRRLIEHLNTRRLRQEIATLSPDAIICTHFLPAEILSRLQSGESMTCPVWVQVTDFDLHRMWVQDHITGYFAASEEVAFRMRAYGISTNKIHVTGIPLMPAFSQKLCRYHCASQFGLDPQRRTVLLMGGGAGLGTLDRIAAHLLSMEQDFQLIVLAGKNKEILARLHALSSHHPGNLLPMGYTNCVAELMACADFAITKPGGLTTSECLAMSLPMIAHAPIPGQEEFNADFLVEQGVALKSVDDLTLEYRIRYLLGNPDKLTDMRRRAQHLGKAVAANHVFETVWKQIEA